MKEIIEWLSSMERTSGEIYRDTEIFFKNDPDFTGLLKHLAEDETWHSRVVASAAGFYEREALRPADIILDQAVRARLERPFLENREKILEGALTRDSLMDCIVTTEFSEWNDIFLYLVNTLKDKAPEFVSVASKMEQHKRYIVRYLETLPEGRTYLDRIKRLPRVWDMRILVVEDYEPIRELVADLLSTEGLVDTAANGAEGLKKTTEQYYDLVLSDSYMGEMSGIEFHKRAVLKDPSLAERFLFLMDDIKDDHLDFIRKRNLRYVLKPFEVDEFRNAVHEMLSKTHPKDGH